MKPACQTSRVHTARHKSLQESLVRLRAATSGRADWSAVSRMTVLRLPAKVAIRAITAEYMISRIDGSIVGVDREEWDRILPGTGSL
jgi:hypothetical protein